MTLSYQQFCDLPLEQQLPLLWEHATFLGWRWEPEGGIGLHHFSEDFFCEVYYEPENNNIIRTRCFTDSAELEPYTRGISLKGLFN